MDVINLYRWNITTYKQTLDCSPKYIQLKTCILNVSTIPRNLEVEGRDLKGIHFAMEYLTQQNNYHKGVNNKDKIHALNKHVVILGGGDTGADCLGTSHRQGASSVTQLELMSAPPETRSIHNPWPEWPLIMRTSSAHEEGGERDYSVLTKKLSGENGKVKTLHAVKVEFIKNSVEEEILLAVCCHK